jgi:hypothetical protein
MRCARRLFKDENAGFRPATPPVSEFKRQNAQSK